MALILNLYILIFWDSIYPLYSNQAYFDLMDEIVIKYGILASFLKLKSGYDQDVVEIENYFCFPLG